MKALDRNDIRILKGIIVKANKLITNISNVATKIEQIEDEYRRKCEEKKAQLEQDKETMMSELAKFEGAVSSIYDCSLDEAREEIFSDEDNVVTDEDPSADVDPMDTTEESEEELKVVDEDVDEFKTIEEEAQELADLTVEHESPEFLDELDNLLDSEGDDEELDADADTDDDNFLDNEDEGEADEEPEEDSNEEGDVVAATVNKDGWDEDSLFAQF